jgi:DNA-binding GntR family transcriptional regulator
MTDAIEWRSRVRLVDEVVEVLRERILSGHYTPGAPLRQEQLAAELNISRTPLREALRMLESDGLVTVSPGRGARVVAGDRERLLAAYQLREVIDGLAARIVAATGLGRGKKALQDAIETQRRALEPWEPRDYTSANIRFHQTIIELSGNEFLIGELPIVHMTSRVFMPFEVVEHGRATRAVGEHQSIVAAMAAADPEESERLARAHVHLTIESLAEQGEPGVGAAVDGAREPQESE